MKLLLPKKKLIDQYRRFPLEGGVYHIENFRVLDNLDAYGVTDNRWKLEFHPATFFKTSSAQIDENGFRFVPIKDIPNHTFTSVGLIGHFRLFLYIHLNNEWFTYLTQNLTI